MTGRRRSGPQPLQAKSDRRRNKQKETGTLFREPMLQLSMLTCFTFCEPLSSATSSSLVSATARSIARLKQPQCESLQSIKRDAGKHESPAHSAEWVAVERDVAQ